MQEHRYKHVKVWGQHTKKYLQKTNVSSVLITGHANHLHLKLELLADLDLIDSIKFIPKGGRGYRHLLKTEKSLIPSYRRCGG